MALPVVAFAMVRVREIVFVRGAVVGARVVARVAVPCAAFLFFVVVVMVVVLAIFSLPASKRASGMMVPRGPHELGARVRNYQRT